MSTFTDYQTFATGDFDNFQQEYDDLDYLFEEPVGAQEDDAQIGYSADSECDEDEEEDEGEEEEEYSSDEDGDYELDEETTPVSSSNITNTNTDPTTNNDTNNNNENDVNKDMATNDAQQDQQQQQQQQQHQEQAQQEGPTQEEVEEWQTQKLESLQKTIESTRSRIEKIQEKITAEESAISNKQAEYDREWQMRNKGQHELQQILAAKKKLEDQLSKKQIILQKSVDKIRSLERDERDVQSNPREEYIKAMKKAGRKRKTRSADPSQTDPFYRLDEGDDSLSEQDGPSFKASSRKRRKNASSACRRCKANKVKCDMKRGQCTHCRLLNKRCRYNDSWDPARQLRPFQLLETEEKLEQTESQLGYYQQLSLTSALADNPLSGITGYGPRTATRARQNYARLNRGMDPISRPSEPTATGASEVNGRQDEALPVPLNRNQNVHFLHQPRPVVPVTPSLPAPSQREVIGTHWIHQTVPPTTPAKRGRKPGQRSSNRPRLSEESTTQPAPVHQVSQQETNPSIRNMQYWWRSKTLASGRHLPVNNDYTPQWPMWISQSNEKQRLWFDYMINAEREIPVTVMRGDHFVGTGQYEVLQPRWPGWTLVMEPPLGEARAGYLSSLLRQGQEVKEIMNLDGTGQGKIDWQFYLSA